MYRISFKSSFIRKFNKSEKDLEEEILDKIALLKNKTNHQKLKVHRLHGRLSGKWSFSVNYKIRIVFKFISKEEIVLLAIGDHAIYR